MRIDDQHSIEYPVCNPISSSLLLFFIWFLQWESSSVARACECVWVYVSPGFERVFIVYIYVCQIVLKTKKKRRKENKNLLVYRSDSLTEKAFMMSKSNLWGVRKYWVISLFIYTYTNTFLWGFFPSSYIFRMIFWLILQHFAKRCQIYGKSIYVVRTSIQCPIFNWII